MKGRRFYAAGFAASVAMGVMAWALMDGAGVGFWRGFAIMLLSAKGLSIPWTRPE